MVLEKESFQKNCPCKKKKKTLFGLVLKCNFETKKYLF